MFLYDSLAAPCQAKREAHRVVADVLRWSMIHAAAGHAPLVGHDERPFTSSWRRSLAGQTLAGGHRAAYFGFKADLKARHESHLFKRWYQCIEICDQCLAQRHSKNCNPALLFTDFSDAAAHLMTSISHSDYVRTHEPLTPWLNMPGFCIQTSFFDVMHCIWLGTAKDLYASALGFWHRSNCLVGNNLSECLQNFSQRMKAAFKAQKMLCWICIFSVTCVWIWVFPPVGVQPFEDVPENGNLYPEQHWIGEERASEYPELGSTFKASSIKCAAWYFAKGAEEIATASPEPSVELGLISVCLWSLHSASLLLDSTSLLLERANAQDTAANFKNC